MWVAGEVMSSSAEACQPENESLQTTPTASTTGAEARRCSAAIKSHHIKKKVKLWVRRKKTFLLLAFVLLT